MRFNELLAGTRGDLAVKVFGEEFGPMLQAANQNATILRGTKGAEDVKVEQTTGLRSWRSRSTRPKSRGSALASSPCRMSSGRRLEGARPGTCSKATGASRLSCA